MCACPSLVPPPCQFGCRLRKPGLANSKLEPDELLPGKIPSGVRRSRESSLKPQIYRYGLHSKVISNISQIPVPLGVKNSSLLRKSSSSIRVGGDSGVFEPVDESIKQKSRDFDPEMASQEEVESTSSGGTSGSLSFDFLELKREMEKEERSTGSIGSLEEEDEEDLSLPGVSQKAISESEEEEESGGRIVRRRMSWSGRQVVKRSSLLAKQVISIQSACSMGFVSQLWVDTRTWLVVLVEVRPSMLSGENEKFLLEDICQVGDVVLIEDESVIENELKMVGLDTLVGYNVVTSRRRNVGKVRGYSFNVDSGSVESLELDSFGMSIIPSSLVSTYCLFVEDVLEVMSDTIVVHDDAMSRLQRLTKGFWDSRSATSSGDDFEEYPEFRRRPPRDDIGEYPNYRGRVVGNRRSRTKFTRRKFPSKVRESDDDWDLPMEY